MKAQKLLAQSLKNVGLAYATVNVENFIGQLEKQTGILMELFTNTYLIYVLPEANRLS
jgi:hypothetical protein